MSKAKAFTVLDCPDCYAVPGANSIIDVINPFTGLTWYAGQTLEEIRARPGYEKAERMTVDAHCAEKAEVQDRPITWHETTEETYNYMFECLPPADYAGGGFLVGEPADHHAQSGQPRYDALKERNGKFFSSNRALTRSEFRKEMMKP